MRARFFLAIASLLAIASSASAATKITLLYTPGDSFTDSYVAKDQGIFAQHGLDITLTAAQNGSVISAALTADSAQIGAPTPTVLLQGDEQGLDLVIIASSTRNPVQPPVPQTVPAADGTATLARFTLNSASWIEVYDSTGKRLYYDLAPAGDNLEVSGPGPLQVFLGNSPGVSLELEGAPFDLKPFLRSDNTARVKLGTAAKPQ